eukprot:m.47878 g.47878  ORF g.47878 m.47878 type:complete len:302 (-) comp10540_c0_seq1:2115-3020(-)
MNLLIFGGLLEELVLTLVWLPVQLSKCIAPCLIYRVILPWKDCEQAVGDFLRVTSRARNLPLDQTADVLLGRNQNGLCIAVFPVSIFGNEFCSSSKKDFLLETAKCKTCSFEEIPYYSLDPEDLSFEEHEVVDKYFEEPTKDGRGGDQGSPGVFSYVRQCFLDHITSDVAHIFVQAMENLPDEMSLITLQHGGGKARETPSNNCAFACREWEWSVVISALWTDPSPTKRDICEKWADTLWTALASSRTGLYVVDIDPIRRDKERIIDEVESTFQENLPRLKKLKVKYDPDNLFQGSVPLSW